MTMIDQIERRIKVNVSHVDTKACHYFPEFGGKSQGGLKTKIFLVEAVPAGNFFQKILPKTKFIPRQGKNFPHLFLRQPGTTRDYQRQHFFCPVKDRFQRSSKCLARFSTICWYFLQLGKILGKSTWLDKAAQLFKWKTIWKPIYFLVCKLEFC